VFQEKKHAGSPVWGGGRELRGPRGRGREFLLWEGRDAQKELAGIRRKKFGGDDARD